MPGFQLFPSEASTISQQTDALFLFLLGVSAIMVTLIGGIIIYSAVKYRRRSEDELPPQIRGSGRLELAWTLIPLGGFMLFFILGAGIYLQEASPPNNAEDVYVVARQWMWKFEHPGGQSEINELHVPMGRPIKLTMTSQDVIHSFFVPSFRIKQDVLPGRYTTTWFQATQVGQYHLFCTQYCGTGHSAMTGYVIVMEPAAYQAWLSSGGGTPAAPAAGTTQSPAAAGEQLFTQNACNSCHKPDGSGVGPSFVGLYGQPVHLANGQTVTMDDNWIREHILQPDQRRVAGYPPAMPSFAGKLSDDQITQIIAYIQSLGSQPPLTPIPGGRLGGAVTTGTPSAGTPSAGTSGTPAPAVGTLTAVASPTGTAVVSPTGTSAAAAQTTAPASPSNPGGPGPALNLTGDSTRGAQVYATSCAVCHGPEGKNGLKNPGSTDGVVPPLNPVDPTLASKDPKVFATNLDLFIEHGSTPAGPSPQIKMPAWGDTKALTPQQVADVISYIINLNQ